MRGQTSLRGLEFYNPESVGTFDRIYQSQDYPNVFLGGQDDLNQLPRPACQIFDVSKTLPEPKEWTELTFEQVKPQFDDLVQKLTNVISTTDCPVFVHCIAGQNRSPAVLASALSKLTGRGVLDILREMKQQRANIGPHDPYLYLATNSSPYENEAIKTEMFSRLSTID